jgi:oligopeptide transport system substrate-binding protein
MPITVRRYLPHALVGLMLLLALTAGGVGVAMGVARHTGAPAVTVLHYANEGTSQLASLDPATGFDLNTRQAAQIIYGGLTRFGPNFQVLPDTAQSWSIGNQGRTYTFHLRPDVRFADGTSLTAGDIAYSFDRTLSPRFADQSGAFILKNIEGASALTAGKAKAVSGIQIVDATTLRIRLQAADGSFLAKLATPAGYIVPRHAITRNPNGWSRNAFGTGPFRVSRWINHTALLLTPNPHYWAGKLQITGIDMPVIPEPLTAYKQYRAGGLDTMGSIHFPTEVLSDVRGNKEFHSTPRLETLFLTPNESVAPFNNLMVRQAFALALNKAAIAHDVFNDFASPTDGMVPPGIHHYHARMDSSYNPTRARHLLSEAGYPAGRGLPPITIALDESAQNATLANELASQWHRTLGVRVDVVPYPHKPYLSVLDRHAYQIAVIDWTADYPDPQNFLSQQLTTDAPNNNGGYSNALFDRTVAKADIMSPANPRRFHLYERAERLAMQQAATIPLVNQNSGILLRRDVHGLSIAGGQLLAADWTSVTITRSGNQ